MKNLRINVPKIKEYLGLPIFVILLFLILFSLTSDAYKSIFAASFVFIFMSTKDEKVFTNAKYNENSKSFFRNGFLGSVTHALFILFGTVVLTSILYMVFVDYCSSSNFLF